MIVTLIVAVPLIDPYASPGQPSRVHSTAKFIGYMMRNPFDAPVRALSDAEERTLRAYRLRRTREQLAQFGVAAAILFDPVNIRYATGSRNMQVWTARNFVRYAFVPVSGPVVLFDYGGAFHLSRHLETIDELRPAKSWEYGISGDRADEHAGAWADEIVDLFRTTCGSGGRLAIDRGDLLAVLTLQARGIELVDAKGPLNIARSIKSTEEIMAIRSAMVACTESVAAMRHAIRPGVSERELLAILNKENISRGGEHQETRLLASGSRTNPYFNEASERVIEAGDLIVFDTDLIGRYGMFADQNSILGRGTDAAERPAAQALRSRARAARIQCQPHQAGCHISRDVADVMAGPRHLRCKPLRGDRAWPRISR